MPHVIVKLWPGKSAADKSKLAKDITAAIRNVLHYGDESVSVAFEEVAAKDWLEQVYKPDIQAKPDTLYKKPGYGPDDL